MRGELVTTLVIWRCGRVSVGRPEPANTDVWPRQAWQGIVRRHSCLPRRVVVALMAAPKDTSGRELIMFE